MTSNFIILMYAFLGAPLLVILVLNLVGRKLTERFCRPIGIGVGLLQILSAVVCLLLLLQYHKDAVSFSQFWDMTASADAAYLSVDVFSLVALFCVGMVATVSFCSATLVKDRIFDFTNMMMVLLLGMNGMALVTDLFSLYIFLEVTGISSFILIALYRDMRGLEGAFKYLVLSAIATAFILLGLAFLFMQVGSLRYDMLIAALTTTMLNPVLVWIAFLCVIAGFCIKAGLVPFHSWLPDAYQSAPAPVSIMLGGIVTKMAGVYALIRLLNDLLLNTYTVMNVALMVLGVISIVVGAIAALSQKDLKRIFAYSSISQIGYIILGASCGSVLGFIGAAFHFFNHATFKSTLFVNAAALEKQAGTTQVDELGGLDKQMPFTATSSVIAFLSAAGIPPLAGFWSKLLIIIAVWQTVGGVVAGIALFCSIFTAAYFLRLQGKVFFGQAGEGTAAITEVKGGIRIAETALTAVTVLCGILFPVLLRILQAQGML